jgi:hypothetical protein
MSVYLYSYHYLKESANLFFDDGSDDPLLILKLSWDNERPARSDFPLMKRKKKAAYRIIASATN